MILKSFYSNIRYNINQRIFLILIFIGKPHLIHYPVLNRWKNCSRQFRVHFQKVTLFYWLFRRGEVSKKKLIFF